MFIVLEKFLKLNNFSRVISDFKDYYQSHPNFPSLFALTDTFSLLNIENVAARIEKEHFADLPNSFLGYVKRNGNDVHLALVKKVKNEVEVQFEKEKPTRFNVDEFKQRWNGIVVAIEPDTADFSSRRVSLSSWGLILTLVFVSGFTFLDAHTFSVSYIFNYAIYVLGAIVSVGVLREKYATDVSQVSKICSLGTNTSCNSVIKSDKAEFTKWIGFSDLGIVFYGAALIAMMMEPKAITFLNSLSVFSLPILIYSIWMQRVVLKTWCVLCLLLSALLMTQSFLAFYNGLAFLVGGFQVILSLAWVCVVWLFIKNHIDTFQRYKFQNKELMRFKREFEIFRFLQEPMSASTAEISGGKVLVGSPVSPVKMSLVISPSCPHCDTALRDALELLEANPNRVKLELFYNLNPENRDNPYLKIARAMLQLNETRPAECLSALKEWHFGEKNVDAWLEKWRSTGTDENADVLLAEQYQWCLQNEFNYTPVKIINDKELSRHYTLSEVKYFISELSEMEEDAQ